MYRKLSVVAVDAIFGHGSVFEIFLVLQIACGWLLLQFRCQPYKYVQHAVVLILCSCNYS